MKRPIIHLDEDHPLTQCNHVNWRLETIKRLQRGQAHQDGYHLSSCFACDESLVPWIKERFKELIAELQKVIVASDGANQTVCYMSFDLGEVAHRC